MPKITLTQKEIVAAITKSVGDMGFQTQGKVITVELTAGRKINGTTAEVSIEDAPETTPQVAPATLINRAEIAPTVVTATTAATIAAIVLPDEDEDEVTELPSEGLGTPALVGSDDLFDEA